jgi:hypothetical protein
MHTIVAGVDPGIVHTGLVVLEFDVENMQYRHQHAVIDGLDAPATADALDELIRPHSRVVADVFVEKYRVRSGFSNDERMIQANKDFRIELRGHMLPNTGVKQVVSADLLRLLDIYQFPQVTHHQDLRSAARIAVLGMLLDTQHNSTLYRYVTDTLDGRTWDVWTD